MKIAQNDDRQLRPMLRTSKLADNPNASWKNSPWLPNQIAVKKLAAWPVAALMPALLSPVRAHMANCRDANATSYISIGVNDHFIAKITVGCLGTCMGASIAQLPESLCSTSLCTNSTTSYKDVHAASFVENGGNLTFMQCMHNVTDAAIGPTATKSHRANMVGLIVLVPMLGLFVAGFASILCCYAYQMRRERVATNAMEIVQILKPQVP